MKSSTIQKRITYWEGILEKLMEAYEALVTGGVKSYTIDGRSLTRFDLETLRDEISEAEAKIDALQSELDGQRPRKAFGIIPAEW